MRLAAIAEAVNTADIAGGIKVPADGPVRVARYRAAVGDQLSYGRDGIASADIRSAARDAADIAVRAKIDSGGTALHISSRKTRYASGIAALNGDLAARLAPHHRAVIHAPDDAPGGLLLSGDRRDVDAVGDAGVYQIPRRSGKEG